MSESSGGKTWVAIFTAVLTAMVALGSVWIGNALGLRNAETQYQDHRRIEAREHAYVKLTGLKALFSQVTRRRIEITVQAEIAGQRYRMLNPSPEILALQHKLVDEQGRLTDRGGEVGRDLFEALAEARVAFSEDDALPPLIAGVNLNPLQIDRDLLSSLRTEADIERVRAQTRADMDKVLLETVERPINEILEELSKRIKPKA
jgi:hypothetical protein